MTIEPSREGLGAFIGRHFCLIFSQSPQRRVAWKDALNRNTQLTSVLVESVEEARAVASSLTLTAVVLDGLAPEIHFEALQRLLAESGSRRALVVVASSSFYRVTRISPSDDSRVHLMLPVDISPVRAAWEMWSVLEHPPVFESATSRQFQEGRA